MAGADRVFLITGGTGFIGKVLLAELARRREELGVAGVHLLIRPRPPWSAERRFEKQVVTAPCFAGLPPDWTRGVEPVPADLSEPGCGLSPADSKRLRERVTHVVHLAAAVDFDLPLADAARSNVASSLEVLELARGCQRLERFVSVSTAYVSPHPGDGVPIEEALAPLPRPAEALYAEIAAGTARPQELLEQCGLPNTYTLTKSLAEHLLAERRGDVPLAILRPSIVSASWRRPLPGWIDSEAAFASFVTLVGAGHLRSIVADPEARLDIVPADEVVDRVLAVAAERGAPASGPPRIRHAVAGLDRSPRVGECGEAIEAFFRRHPIPGGSTPRLRYLGPPGWRFACAHWLHHALPIHLASLSTRSRVRGRRMLARLEAMNEIFPYFTQRSFDFRSSLPFDAPGFERGEYLETVCRGVHEHLLGTTRRRRGGPRRP